MRISVTTVLVAVLAVLISTGAAWWAGAQAPTIRGSATEIVVPSTGAGGRSDAARLESAKRGVLDPLVLRTAARRLDMSSADLERRLDASIVDDRSRIRIVASARTGARATQILDAFVPIYIGHLDAEQAEPGRPTVFTSPRALDEPLAPTPRRSAVLGAAVGLILACFLIIWSVLHRATTGEAGPARPR